MLELLGDIREMTRMGDDEDLTGGEHQWQASNPDLAQCNIP